MTYFLRFGDSYRLTPTSAVNIKEKLPGGTYAVKRDDNGFFLDVIKNFDIPSKLYGDCNKHVDRIINTFWDRPNSTGIFLEGEKGSGKTLLGKAVSRKLIDSDVPTIVVNNPFFGEDFNTFLQSINQPKIVFFDEFEKIYSNDDDGGLNAQERVLTLFDGVYPSKTLFVVTCNDSWRVDKNMKNRPGRMYYMLSFKGLDDNFIKEYAEENLKDKSEVKGILTVATLFDAFNFDMLKALCEEMNRYNETAQEAIKMLNTKPSSGTSTFDVRLFVEGKEVEIKRGYNEWNGNPLTGSPSTHVLTADSSRYETYAFEPNQLVSIDGEQGTYTYQNGKGEKLVLKRKVVEEINWTKFV